MIHPTAGEAWAPDLQKLALVDGSSKEEIGHLYLDLYARFVSDCQPQSDSVLLSRYERICAYTGGS